MSESVAEDLSTMPSDVPPESVRQAENSIPLELSAQSEVTPAAVPDSLPDVSNASIEAALPQDPPSEEPAGEIATHVVETPVAPVDHLENQGQKAALPIDEAANEMIAEREEEAGAEEEPSGEDYPVVAL
jgi:hypothetical protein